jgi:hypothetical protein
VLDEYVSIEAARDRYGVVLTGSVEECDIAVDEAATIALRAKLAAARGVTLALDDPDDTATQGGASA